jgi:hypothetical protein
MVIPPGDLVGRKAIAGALRGLAARHEKPIKTGGSQRKREKPVASFRLQD